jgi:SLT domain-containing protein
MFNPLANLYAGLNYAISRYGSIAAVDPLRHAGGYDTGGMLPPGGLGANYGKKPERVLSGQQTESFERLVSLLSSGAARGGGGATLAATNRTIVLQVNGREITRVVLDGMDNAITGGLTRVGVS